MNDLTDRIARLSPEKRDLLLAKLGKRDGARPSRIQRRSQDSRYVPLSFAQKRLWFLDRYEPQSAAYNIPAAYRLRGALDAEALRRSLDGIVRRHESLRTAFPAIDGKPAQYIAPAYPIELPVDDLRDLPPQQREARARALVAREAHRPFDLARGPLFRCALFRLDDDDHILLLAMHHIVSDGWSMGILMREFSELYDAHANGREPHLPDLPVQYADFTIWQREWLTGTVLEEQLAYWRGALGGCTETLDLPTDRPRPPIKTYRGDARSIVFSPELSTRLRELGTRMGATLFMTLFAGFTALLHRYTGQRRIVVGTPIAGRNRTETEGLIGFFVNTLALCTDCSGDPPFEELLARVMDTALGAYAHQDLPFEKLVEEIEPVRDPSRTPIFQVLFTLHGEAGGQPSAQGFSASPITVPSGTAKFDVTISMVDDGTRLGGWLEYNTDLFDPSTTDGMATHFERILGGIVADPAARLSTLPLLTEAERRRMLVTWNESSREYPRDATVHELFERRAARCPDAPAVRYGDATVTYGVLNRRANRIAHYLRSRGVGIESPVGVCMERSIDAVSVCISILKAGGAYVPLDPEYPRGRIAVMMREAGVRVVVTDERSWDTAAGDDRPGEGAGEAGPAGFFPGRDVTVVRCDADGEAIATFPGENPTCICRPENVAYVMYTSGSTGTPKGIAVAHRAIVRLVVNTDFVKIDPDDSLAQVATFSFDAATFEIWGALLNGACIIGIDRDTILSPAAFAAALERDGIGIMFLTASLFNQMARYEPDAFRSLRTLIAGGEALDPHWVRTVLQHGAPERLLNGYGPTESTTFASWFHIEEVPEDSVNIPIGSPVANTRIYILDHNFEPVPVGAHGELCIGGDGLARGYIQAPSLTAERFIPDPFDSDRGGRLYRTGDVARYLPGGDVAFMGRRDDQVKVRGFRIEPGEIETVLREHPAIRDSVIIAGEGATGERRLVAYFVRAGEMSPPVGDLRIFCQRMLPDYMIPAVFVSVESIPLTPNGKVDRGALPSPDRSRPAVEEEFVAPRSPVEKELAAIWADILGLKKVGVHDNFFELGGDSIISIQIIARAHRRGVRLTPKDLFQHQTIAGLAAVADTAPSVRAEQETLSGEAPLVPIQRWFFERSPVEPHHFNQAFMLAVRRRVDVELLNLVIAGICMHHDSLRLQFHKEDEGWRQIYTAPDPGNEMSMVERIDISDLDEAEQARAILAGAAGLQGTFDLAVGPLIRCVLFDRGPERGARLLVVMHHLVVDGVSWRILLEDIEEGYQRLERGEPLAFPPKTTSYRYWGERLLRYARSKECRDEITYWTAEIWEMAPPLPVDNPRGGSTVASSRIVSAALDAEETGTLLREVPAAYGTRIDDALLAACALAFQRWTGENLLLVELEGHGREGIFDDVDISRTVGWFTTLFPVMLNIRGMSGVGEVLKAIKEQLRAVPNRGLGYGVLRYCSDDPGIIRRLDSLPRAEISFNYLGRFDRARGASSLLEVTGEATGPQQSPRAERAHLLDVTGIIRDDRLRLAWRYSDEVHSRETIERLAAWYIEALREIIGHCVSPEAGGYTPSDFEHVELSQGRLDRILKEIGEDIGEE